MVSTTTIHMPRYVAYASGGCFGPGGVILPASKCGSRAGTTKPAPSPSPPPAKHTGGSSGSKHSTSGGCMAAGGEILSASQCKKVGIKPGTHSTSVGAQGQKVASGQKSGRTSSTGGCFAAGGEILTASACNKYGIPLGSQSQRTTAQGTDINTGAPVIQSGPYAGHFVGDACGPGNAGTIMSNGLCSRSNPAVGVAPPGSSVVINPIRDYLGSKNADNPTGLNHFANYARVNAGAGVLQELTSGHAKITDVPNIAKQGLCSLGAPLCGSAPGYNAPASVIRGAGAVGKGAAVLGKATEGVVGMAPDIMMNILRPLWEQQGLLPKKPVAA